MDNKQSALRSPAAADPATNSTSVLSLEPDATLGNDQYSVMYSTTAYPLDTLRSYSVGGRPAVARRPHISASSARPRSVYSAPPRKKHNYGPLGLILLLGLVAAGFVLTTHAHLPSPAAATATGNSASDQSASESVLPAVDKKNVRSAAYLGRLASTVNQNQKLPRRVEDYMQELNAKGSEGVFQYRFRMTKVVASEFNSDAFLATQKLAAMKTQCAEPEDTGNLLKQGVTVRYSYVDKHNTPISSFDLTSDDCP